jgi:hypothetical protein
MIFCCDLLQPRRSARVAFVTADAMAVGKLGGFDLRVLNMGLVRTVARFAGNSFVLELGNDLERLAMTFDTGLLTCIDRCLRSDLRQGAAAIVAVLVKGGRRKNGLGQQVNDDNPNDQEKQSKDLRWQFARRHKCGFTLSGLFCSVETVVSLNALS